MKILGIVGEICAGKTTIAKTLVDCTELNNIFTSGIVCLEGDEEIRKMYQEDKLIIDKIHSLYQDCIINDAIDTKLLGKFFFESTKNQELIESITHPVLREKIFDFIAKNRKTNILLILDVPVLFKLKLNHFCDYIAYFTANHDERVERGIKRIIAKHDMTDDEAKNRFLKINNIVAKQDELQTSIVIDTTNYQNNKDFTIDLSIKKIVNFLSNI